MGRLLVFITLCRVAKKLDVLPLSLLINPPYL
jgi:hypothetical protein